MTSINLEVKDMTSENIGIFQKVLILLGSFAITYNIAIALHELSHIL